MLSQRTRYALRALLHIVEHGGDRVVQISELAQMQAIPQKFLEAIMVDLKKIGVVESRRGRSGGYRLLKDPDTIMFAEIIRALDGPIALVPCASENFYKTCGDCIDEKTCAIRRVFMNVRQSAIDILENTSLSAASGLELTQAAR